VVRVCLLMGDNIFSLNVHVQLLVCTVLSVILSQGVSRRAVSQETWTNDFCDVPVMGLLLRAMSWDCGVSICRSGSCYGGIPD